MWRSPSRGRLLLDDGELLFSALQSCLNTLSDWECVGVDNSDTSGVDSSSLSPPGTGDRAVEVVVPIRRSFSFDSFSRLAVGTGITTSSFNVEDKRLLVDTDDVVFRGILFPIHLSSVDFDLIVGFGDDGGETNSEDGLVLVLLPLLFRVLCEQADLVLR